MIVSIRAGVFFFYHLLSFFVVGCRQLLRTCTMSYCIQLDFGGHVRSLDFSLFFFCERSGALSVAQPHNFGARMRPSNAFSFLAFAPSSCQHCSIPTTTTTTTTKTTEISTVQIIVLHSSNIFSSINLVPLSISRRQSAISRQYSLISSTRKPQQTKELIL